MPNPYFQFKQFTVYHDRCAMKVTTDSCFFGGWVAKEMQVAKDGHETVLDIGTGCGLLSLIIAQKNDVEIDAVEIDKEASMQAKENADASPWKNRIRIYNEDILSFKPAKKYDYIISNPPFYEKELASLHARKNIAHHSGQLSIAQLSAIIKDHLSEEGRFFLLLPYKRKEEIEKLLRLRELHPCKSVILKQSVNHPPFRFMVMGTRQKNTAAAAVTISIWNDRQQYTPEFVELLKDYYLHL